MEFYNVTFFVHEEQSLSCELDRLGEGQSLYARIKGSHDEINLHFDTDLQWIAFKNSVLSADAKMFGKR